MDHSLNKDWVGWLYLESCNQWLSIQMQNSDEQGFSGDGTGARAVQYLCWQHGQHTLCSVSHTTGKEQRAAIQKDLDRLRARSV